MSTDIPVETASDVARSLENNQPVVALETAVVTHGLPAPDNLSIARELAETVRQNGAVPATVAFLNGVLHIGMNDEELRQLARETEPVKLSSRDLAWAAAAGASGGTTVAGTLAACRLVGIRVFATGGIGGVHPGYPQHHDASADLHALADTQCCVVSAGAKAILDLHATLEHLDTLGVPVVGYRTDYFPRFYSEGTAALPVPRRLDSAEQVARMLDYHWRILQQSSGVLLCNPLPPEVALPLDLVEKATHQAQDQAEREKISGRDLTPFLLSRVAELTEGASLRANLQLLRNNARLAAELACSLH